MEAAAAPLTLVTAPGCHLCERGRLLARMLADEHRMEYAEVDWFSPEGERLVRAGAPAFPPALFLGSELLQYGRLSEGRLRRLLARTAA